MSYRDTNGPQKKLADLLESLCLKDDDLKWARQKHESCLYGYEGDLTQDDHDKITELWERYC